MKQKTIEAMAVEDAREWGFAKMFFGEGAGIRRRLVEAEISQKLIDYADTDYADLFNLACENLNQIELAEAAIKERKKIDAMAKAGKNVRAFKSGNYQNLSTGVFLVVGAAYLAHQTGYDKVIVAETKKQYKKAKTEFKFHKARLQGRNVERIF